MVLDRNSHAAALGDVYLVAGTLRRIEGSSDLLLVFGSKGDAAIRVQPGDVCTVDELLLGSGRDYVLYGENLAGGVTTLELTMDGGHLIPGLPGIPVAAAMLAKEVAAVFLADNTPAGPWTATLERRPAGGSWNPVATFAINTS